MTPDQYKILSQIEAKEDIENVSLKRKDGFFTLEDYTFFKKNSFIKDREKEKGFPIITFKGRVALAAYEAQHESS